MKTYQKSSVSKLVAGFDKQLKNILVNDLKIAKAIKIQFINSQTLNAA